MHKAGLINPCFSLDTIEAMFLCISMHRLTRLVDNKSLLSASDKSGATKRGVSRSYKQGAYISNNDR